MLLYLFLVILLSYIYTIYVKIKVLSITQRAVHYRNIELNKKITLLEEVFKRKII